ncbi:MAG: aminoacyl-tRNA hydrolase [Chitinispirillia bacterium]|nr:aminoacyl-tRNA hydrolase [Chitinispirillia bacterium]
MRLISKFFKKFFEKRQAPDKPEMLIFGLGNPGGKYGGTRHNIGFCVIDEIADLLKASEPMYCCESEIRMVRMGDGRRAALVKPLTYMNLSGSAVSACMAKWQVGGDKCLIIVDDFNIALGKIRFRKDGTHGGHNGLKSIEASVGRDIPRLRVGIGPLPKNISIIDFVLGRFEEQEQSEVREVVKKCAEAVSFSFQNDFDTVMNRYN